jgi:hypothetical protein
MTASGILFFKNIIYAIIKVPKQGDKKGISIPSWINSQPARLGNLISKHTVFKPIKHDFLVIKQVDFFLINNCQPPINPSNKIML